MGKSIKKSSSKVDTTPVTAPQSVKKGKRSAENEIEKAVSVKKQKVERDETVVATQKVLKKQPKKAAISSSDDESDESDSDSEPKVVAKKGTFAAKKGTAVSKRSKMDTSSDSSDSSESDSDDSDEKLVVKKQPAAVITTKKSPPTDCSDTSECDSDDDDDVKPAAALRSGLSKDSSSSEESDSDSSDEEGVKKVAAQPKNAEKKPAGSSDSSDSDESSSDEDDSKNVVAQPKNTPKKQAESSDSSDSDESSSDEDNAAKTTPAGAAASKGKVEPSDNDSDEEDDSSDSDEEPKANKPKVQAPKESSSSGESSDEDDSDEEENENQSPITPKKKDSDVKMVDAEKSGSSTFLKTPKQPATPQATGSKTLFAANLPYSVEESDVREFFKGVGGVVDVRLASDAEGVFRGFGHVEFATAEIAQKALELHEQELLGRQVRLDLARERERGAFTPQSRENTSFQKGGRAQGQSIFVRGFDTSLGEHEIRTALQEHFGSCGEIARVSIPKDYDTGGVKGIAYMDFADSNGFKAALELNNSELGGGYLTVQEAKPRGDSAGNSGGRFDRGGRSGGRGGRDGGRFSGRGSRDGGRFSGRGGRDGGRGRGRGTPYKPSVTAMASGKKTTFGDD